MYKQWTNLSDPSLSHGFKIQPSKASTSHYFISDVDKNSPADNAGLCKGDRIVEVNGVNIREKWIKYYYLNYL